MKYKNSVMIRKGIINLTSIVMIPLLISTSVVLVSGCVMPAPSQTQTPIVHSDLPQQTSVKIMSLGEVSHHSEDFSTDHTGEIQYLNNSITLLRQIKQLAAAAQNQKNPDARKRFDYSILVLDIETIILGIKRYIAASDNTPRRMRERTPVELHGQYINDKY